MVDPAADRRSRLAPKALGGLAAVACCAPAVPTTAGVVGVLAAGTRWLDRRPRLSRSPADGSSGKRP
ncbi:hypothetical protein [Nocardiopsis baichengensis]|uniref:hypothetical protein n=1 Tax=Nocardiopsis baichengensis TaxID=280240 RepID=UPI000379DF8E|nr:hypothetical protein [Nocardiopsis baichengensis]